MTVLVLYSNIKWGGEKYGINSYFRKNAGTGRFLNLNVTLANLVEFLLEQNQQCVQDCSNFVSDSIFHVIEGSVVR